MKDDSFFSISLLTAEETSKYSDTLFALFEYGTEVANDVKAVKVKKMQINRVVVFIIFLSWWFQVPSATEEFKKI